MKTYKSQTGYIKFKTEDVTEIYEGSIIYLPDREDLANYSDASKEEYEAYVKEQEERYAFHE